MKTNFLSASHNTVPARINGLGDRRLKFTGPFRDALPSSCATPPGSSAMESAAHRKNGGFHAEADRGGRRDTDFQAGGLSFSEKFLRVDAKSTRGAKQKPATRENQTVRTWSHFHVYAGFPGFRSFFVSLYRLWNGLKLIRDSRRLR
ncbi:hypothetical protein [Shinella sp. HZN7]|uniref:hypothetical protein n=1 Tax=Shinella sp. (strain HZN7) TaxID=879274 RepID=UPI0011AB86CA|nr:hypothetical protein [Shinella sp. HZN7]